jgi:hypothetical protein
MFVVRLSANMSKASVETRAFLVAYLKGSPETLQGMLVS